MRLFLLPAFEDEATVVFAYPLSSNPLFMVECVDANGVTRWLADVHASEMELLPVGGDVKAALDCRIAA